MPEMRDTKTEKKTFGPKSSFGKIAIMAGAIVAFTIGSGFATGQEVLQYFSSYGFWGIFGGGLIMLTMLVITYIFVARVGHRERFTKPTGLFYFLGGRYLGMVLDFFFVVQMFLLFTMMISGGGALFKQHYGLSVYLGGIVVAIVVSATAWFGLRNLIEIIGRIGPLIVLAAVALGIVGLFNATDGLAEGNRVVADLEIVQASAHWLPAAISYAGVVILMLTPFVGTLGKGSTTRKQAGIGGAAGAIAFTVGGMIAALGLLANIGRVFDMDIPLMVLAQDISPVVASLISVVILAGIYTTAVPLLWSVSSRFYKDRTTGFKIVTILTAVLGSVVGLAVPFPQLVNFTFQMSGYVGILVFVLIIVHLLFRRGKTAPEPTEQPTVTVESTTAEAAKTVQAR